MIQNIESFRLFLHKKNVITNSLKILIKSNIKLTATTLTTDNEINEINELPDIPTYLPSALGIDYIPLATMLAIGDYKNADQFTRDNLIKISGAEKKGRNFVYWTEVHTIPDKDLGTMEYLWLHFSKGNFGYSIQKRIWLIEKENYDNFIRRIGWTMIDNGIERNLRWFGKSEFIYENEKAPQGHLPLTNALRGTQLMKQLLTHPLWDKYDWKDYENIKWKE